MTNFQKPYREGPHIEYSITLAMELIGTKPKFIRRWKMERCNCRLCYLCLNPPQTFALYESFGLDKIGKESEARIYKQTKENQTDRTEFDNRVLKM